MRKVYLKLILLLFVLFAVPLHADNVLASTPAIYVGKTDVEVSAGTISKYVFTPVFSGSYTFCSVGSADTYGYLYSADGTVLKSDDDSGTDRNFKITYTLEKGVQYYFGVEYYSPYISGTISVELADNFTELSNEANSITVPNTEQTFCYTSYITGNYEFSFLHYNFLDIMMYDENGTELSAVESTGSKLTYELRAGKRYYLSLKNHGSSSRLITVTVTDPAVSTGYVDTRVKVGKISLIRFIPDESASYIIRTNSGNSPIVYVYGSAKNTLLIANRTQSEKNVDICMELTKGENYYIGIKRTDGSSYVNETLYIKQEVGRLGKNTAIIRNNATYRVPFDAPVSGKYRFYSDGNEVSSVDIRLYSEKGTCLISEKRKETFSFEYDLVQGERYFIRIELNGGNFEDFPFYIEPDVETLSCGTYTFNLNAGDKVIRKLSFPYDRKYNIAFTSAEEIHLTIYDQRQTVSYYGGKRHDLGIGKFFKADETSMLEFGFSDSEVSGSVTLTISEESISSSGTSLSCSYLDSGSIKVTVPKTADYRLKLTPNSSATAKLLDTENTVLASCDESTTGTIILKASLQADETYYLFIDQTESDSGLNCWVEIEEDVLSVAAGDNTVTIPAGKTVRLLWSAPYTGNFDIYTTGSNDTVGALYSLEGEKLAENDDYNGNRNFRLNRYFKANKKYYIDVRYYSNYLSGDVNLHIEEQILELGENTIDLPSLSITKLKYVIPEDGTYSFYTTGDDYTIAKTIRANVNSPYQLFVGDVYTGGEGHNFRYTYTFSKGTTVNMQICYNDAQNSALMGRWCEGSGQINLVIEKTNWTWNMNGDVLTISGTGALPDFTSYGAPPWYNYYVREVVFSEGITSIGGRFLWCSNIERVTVPLTVSYISPRAFSGCSLLTSVEISPENPYYTAKDGAVFNKNGTMLVCVLPGMYDSYEVPDGTTAIGDYSFIDAHVTDITLPSSVARIGCEAMMRSDIKSIKILNPTVTNYTIGLNFCYSTPTIIGYSGSTAEAYANQHRNPFVAIKTNSLGLDVTWANEPSDTLVIIGTGNSVMPSYDSSTYMNAPWYSARHNIKYVKMYGISKIGDYSFYGLDDLEKIVVPDGVTEIGAFAYSGCTRAATVTLPDSLAKVGDGAFYGCDALNAVIYFGTEEMKDQISVGENNEQLLNAQWLCVTSVDDICIAETVECEHGSVTLSRSGLCSKGMELTVTATPESGYVLAQILVNGNQIMPDENGSYSFVIRENSRVSASFVPHSVTGIQMKTEPLVKEYAEQTGVLDLTGATIELLYNDGMTDTVDVTEDMVSGFDPTVIGDQDITVTYEGFTCSFTVTVLQTGVTLEKELVDGKEVYVARVSNVEKIREHGILIGTDPTIEDEALTLDTPGRTRLAYQEYEADGKSYLFAPDGCEKYVIRAYVIEEDGTVYLSSAVHPDAN